MTIAALGNLKIRISTKGGDGEMGLKIIRNEARSRFTDNKKPESKKRGSDNFQGDAGKEKRRRMDYRSITQDCCRVLPAPPTMIHIRGWDCQKKLNKSPESWEQGCQDMKNSCEKKTPPLQNENESCRPDHSSRATINEGSLTVAAQLSPTKALRAAQLKKRFANLIFKANHHQSVMPHGNKPDPLEQQQETERLQKLQEIDEEIKAAETLVRMRADADLKIQIHREREAARIALEKMEKTVEFDDARQIMRDFESLLNSVC